MAMIVNRSGSTVEGRLHGTTQATSQGDAVLLDENGKVPASFIPNYDPPVTSVNGETGDVHLDASDVGALPDSTTYVSSVNGKIGAVTLTARDVGALPNDTAIPVVYDAKLTIQRNGYKVAEFTSNASEPVIANIEVPTSASDVSALSSDTVFATINGTSVKSNTPFSLQTPLTAGTDYVAHSDSASKIYGTNGSKADTTYALDTGTISSSSTDAQIPTSLTVYEGLSIKQNNLTFTDVSITESD